MGEGKDGQNTRNHVRASEGVWLQPAHGPVGDTFARSARAGPACNAGFLYHRKPLGHISISTPLRGSNQYLGVPVLGTPEMTGLCSHFQFCSLVGDLENRPRQYPFPERYRALIPEMG